MKDFETEARNLEELLHYAHVTLNYNAPRALCVEALRDSYIAGIMGCKEAVAAQGVIMGRWDTAPRLEEIHNALRVMDTLLLPHPVEKVGRK